MTSFVIDPDVPTPMAKQLATELRLRIDRGDYEHNSRLPPMRELSEAAGVSLSVVRQAISYLASEGLVRTDSTRGVFVSQPAVSVKEVALVAPLLSPQFVDLLMAGLIEGLEGTPYRVVVESAKASYDGQMELLERLDPAFLAGVVIPPPPFARHAETIREIVRRGLPCVQVLSCVDQQVASAVTADDFVAGRVAIDKLLSLGHRRIGILDHNGDAASLVQLRQGMDQRLRSAGLRLADLPVVEGDAEQLDSGHPMRASQEAARFLLERYPDVTAVVGVTTNRAIGAYTEARRMGMNIPGDLSIIGLGCQGIEHEILDPVITMLDWRPKETGQHAANLLQQMIKGELKGAYHLRLEPRFMAGGTLAPPRESRPTA